MSKGQLSLLKQILRAGHATAEAPLDQLRENFERFNAKFPEVEGLRTEPVEIGGLRAEWVDARPVGGSRGETDRSHASKQSLARSVAEGRAPAILYLHGGGFVVGSIDSHRQLAARLSAAAHAVCLNLDYRRAPEHPYPAALDDTLATYAWLLGKCPPGRLALAGDSAGAGLATLALTRLRRAGSAMPAALLCLCPWVDFAGTGESLDRHGELDPVVRREGLERMASLYLGDADPWHEEVTPLRADLSGLPPMLIQAGGAETLLDDARRLAERASAQGVSVELDIWPDMIHVWHLFAGRLEEGKSALESAGAWLRRHWVDASRPRLHDDGEG